MDSLIRLTRKSIKKIKKHKQFLDWVNGYCSNKSDIVIINNSFVYRDVPTSKSNYYLTLKFKKNRQFEDQIFVGSGLKRINNDFKDFQSKQLNGFKIVDLASAISDQLNSVGYLVFALVGRVEKDLTVEENFNQGPFLTMICNPSQKEMIAVKDDMLYVKNTGNEDALWSELTKFMKANKFNIPLKMKTEFGSVLDKLQSRAVAKLSIPSHGKDITEGITDTIVKVLKEQRDSYVKSLDKCDGGDPSGNPLFNEILRIAYNFASDASNYLQLIVSICDLKPIILWATIGEHYSLSEAFRQLPWARSKYKPSLKNYIDTVSDARNKRFHDAFPFEKALRLALPSSAVQNPEIQFFSEYNPRSNLNEFTFNDKPLVDILLKFNRARQRPVSSDFWKKNIEVMNKTIDLFSATSKSLKLIHALV